MGRIFSSIIVLLCCIILLAGTSQAKTTKEVYLKDGGIIECQKVWQANGKVMVLVNRDTLVDFSKDEVDLQKTFAKKPVKKVKKAKVRKKVAAKPGAVMPQVAPQPPAKPGTVAATARKPAPAPTVKPAPPATTAKPAASASPRPAPPAVKPAAQVAPQPPAPVAKPLPAGSKTGSQPDSGKTCSTGRCPAGCRQTSGAGSCDLCEKARSGRRSSSCPDNSPGRETASSSTSRAVVFGCQ